MEGSVYPNAQERKESVMSEGGEREGGAAGGRGSAAGGRGSAAGGRGSAAGGRGSGSDGRAPLELDAVLAAELGQFGWYQARCLLLAALPLMLCAAMNDYIFAAAAVPHRCQIPECGENSKSVPFAPEWLSGAVPPEASCERYAPTPSGANGTLLVCPATLFNRTTTVPCQGYVYERDNSVVYEWDLGCGEWLRALAGSLNSAGSLLALPLAGWVSDRWGRRAALLLSLLAMVALGVLRTFSRSYGQYLALQLLQTTFGAGTFSSAYVFVMESVGPRYRVVTSATASSMFAVGGVLLGGTAWALQHAGWRALGRALLLPGALLLAGYCWLLRESVRWLLSARRGQEGRAGLREVARANGTSISEKSLAALTDPPPLPSLGHDQPAAALGPGVLAAVLGSRALRRRVLTTPVWWVTGTLVYYGLSINSTSLAGNMYGNYMATCAVEIPGFYTAVLVLGRWGRRGALAAGFLLSAACNLATAFIPEDLSATRLVVFLVGKFGISAVFTSLYLFTSELYPTSHRHSLLAFSSMVGRLGSIAAPLTPALKSYWPGLPSLLFACMSLVSAALVRSQPETRGRSLPDSPAEAAAIGRTPHGHI